MTTLRKSGSSASYASGSKPTPKEIWTVKQAGVEHRGYGPFELPQLAGKMRTTVLYSEEKQLLKPNFTATTRLTADNADVVVSEIAAKAPASVTILSGDTGIGKTTIFPLKLFKVSQRTVYVVVPTELQARDAVRYRSQHGAVLDDGSRSVNPIGVVYTWAAVAIRRVVLDLLQAEFVLVDEAHYGLADVLILKVYFATFKTTFRVIFMSATHPEVTLPQRTHMNDMTYVDMDFNEEDIVSPSGLHPWFPTNSTGHWLVFAASRANAEALALKLHSSGNQAVVLSERSDESDIQALRDEMADARGLVLYVIVSPVFSTGFSLGINNAIDLSVEDVLYDNNGVLTKDTVPITEVILRQRIGRVARVFNDHGVYVRRKTQFSSRRMLERDQIMSFKLWMSFLRLRGDLYGNRAIFDPKLAGVLLSMPYRPEVLVWYFTKKGLVYDDYADFLELVGNTHLERAGVFSAFECQWPDGVLGPVPHHDVAAEFHRVAYACRSKVLKPMDVQLPDFSSPWATSNLRAMTSSPVISTFYEKGRVTVEDEDEGEGSSQSQTVRPKQFQRTTYPPRVEDRRVSGSASVFSDPPRRRKYITPIVDRVVPMKSGETDEEEEEEEEGSARDRSVKSEPVRRVSRRLSRGSIRAQLPVYEEETYRELDYRYPEFIIPVRNYRVGDVTAYLTNVPSGILAELKPYVDGEKLINHQSLERQRLLLGAFSTSWNSNVSKFMLAGVRYKRRRYLDPRAFSDMYQLHAARMALKDLQNIFPHFGQSGFTFTKYDPGKHLPPELS